MEPQVYRGYNIEPLYRSKGTKYKTIVASTKEEGYIIGRAKYQIGNDKSLQRALVICKAYVDQRERRLSNETQ